MSIRYVFAAGTAAIALAAAQPAFAQSARQQAPAATVVAPPIEFTEWKLANGLKVIALPDDTTRTVYTSVWYDVGSKNDPEGRSGFAHMFEHILSRKTRNMPYNMIYGLTADVGGTRNASTSDDRTNYFEVVPAEYLETMLWTHRERMAFPVVDEQVFESERAVVKEEFRTRIASQPYGPLFGLALPENAFDTLPQRRPTIGTISELDSAKLGDALAFHQAYYGPDSATLIVAGNFKLPELKSLVDKYFADIPRRAAPVSADIAREAKPMAAARAFAATNPNVPLPVTGYMWRGPGATHPDVPALMMLDAVLGTGASSRWQDALVRTGKASDMLQQVNLTEDGSYFAAFAFVPPTGDLDAVAGVVSSEIERVRSQPVSAAELSEAKNQFFASRLNARASARGRADEIGEAMVVAGGNAQAANMLTSAIAKVTPADIQRVARTWLAPENRIAVRYSSGPADPASYANPVPMPEFKTLAPATATPLAVLPEGERQAVPGPGAAPTVVAPRIVTKTLANGLEVVAAKTNAVPLVTMTAVVPGGTIIDERSTAGLSALAASLAEQGTATMDARQLAAAFESLGANFSVSPGDEGTLLSVNAPAATAEAAGKLMVEVLRGASYPADQVAIQKKRVLDNIVSLRSNPGALAGAVAAPILFGDAPYGIAGSEETIGRITPADLVAYREKWWRPDTMKFVVSGGLAPEASVALAERLLGGWKASGTAPALPAARAGTAAAPRTVVVDLPDAGQAAVYVAVRAPARSSADYFPLSVANAILGGDSSGRLFNEIRTKRSLSYGSYSSQPGRSDEAYLTATSQTKNETADEVLGVILGELDALAAQPFAPTLIDARRRFLVGGHERRLESSAGFNSLVAGLLQQGLSAEEAARYADNLAAVTPEAAQAAAAKYVRADRATVIVAGDAKLFLDDLKKIRPDVTVIKAADLDFADPLGTIGG